MINFFRKTRKKLADDNKLLKYSRYAIGEILLVVIGILIALSINNWNEEQKNKIKATDYLDGIASEIRIDTATIGNALKRIDWVVSRKMWTINSINYATVPTDSLLYAFGSPDLRDYKITETTFSKISDLSVLDLIENDSLVEAIIRYYSIEKDKYHGTIEWDMTENQYENNIINYESEVDFISIYRSIIVQEKISNSELIEQINKSADSLRESIISFLNRPKIRNLNHHYIFRNRVIKNDFESKRQASTQLLQKIEAQLDHM